MKKILSTLDNISTGKVKGAATANKNEMKAILESFSKVAECGDMMPPMPAPEMDRGNPVTVNVSLNASGKEHVQDLLDLLKMAGVSGASMPMDMPKLAIDMDGDNQPDLALDKEEGIEEWDNSPEGVESEPDYQDSKFMTKDISGGINREKKAFKKAQDGDNAMAVESIKERLLRALSEKKSNPEKKAVKEGAVKSAMMKDAEQMSKADFIKKYGAENADTWANVNESIKEGWDDMLKAVKDKSKPQPNGGAGKKQGTRYGGGKQKDEPEATDKKKK
jgi:hypothetical protein